MPTPDPPLNPPNPTPGEDPEPASGEEGSGLSRPLSAAPGRPVGRPGIGPIDVQRAADALLRLGKRPTLAAVREYLRRGSPNTIQPLLDDWWHTIGARLDAGPAALHRLPESVLHIVEALWLQMLEDARRRVAAEQRTTQAQLTDQQQTVDVRSYVLTLREGELDRRLRDRDAAATTLETQVAALSTLLRKEQAAREHERTRIADLERELTQTREQLAAALICAPADVMPAASPQRRQARPSPIPRKTSSSKERRTRIQSPRRRRSANARPPRSPNSVTAPRRPHAAATRTQSTRERTSANPRPKPSTQQRSAVTRRRRR